MPITWRNVDAPNFSAANDLLNQGANRLTSSLTGIGTQLDERVDRQKDVWDQTKEANTEEYLGQISGASDMDAIANLRASLTPEYMKENYGNQINLRAVNTALQDQGKFVRQDTMEQQQFDDFNTERGERELRNQVMMLQSQGRHDEARALAQNLSNSGELFQNIQQAERGDVQWDWAKTDQAMKVGRYNMDLEDRKLSRIQREAAQQREALGNSLHELGANLAMDWGLNRAEAREAAKVYARENGIEAKVLNNFLSDFDKNWDNYRGMTPEQEAEVNHYIAQTLEPQFEEYATPYRSAIQQVDTEMNNIPATLRAIGERPMQGEVTQEILKESGIDSKRFYNAKVFDDAAEILGIPRNQLDPRIVKEAFSRAPSGTGRWWGDTDAINDAVKRELIKVQQDAVQAQIRVQELKSEREQNAASLREVERLHKENVFNVRRSAGNMGVAQQNLYEALGKM